ncbi:hypothetical protein AAVH_10253 [Aphelenchoides avenae]|nr:hypothetical protein AAVH_10253 [Aphelenchus avenae]
MLTAQLISAWSASAAVFRLEVQVLGRGNAPSKRQDYELEHLRNGEKWLLKVKHYRDEDYSLSLLPPQAARSVSYRRYQRTDDGDVRYTEPNTQLIGALDVATFYIGVEVSVAGEQPTNASRSPWTFTSSEQMPNWDVILSVGETNFYAHRAVS